MKLGTTRVGAVAVSFWKALVKPEISLRFAPTTAVDTWAPKLRVEETQAMDVMEAMPESSPTCPGLVIPGNATTIRFRLSWISKWKKNKLFARVRIWGF